MMRRDLLALSVIGLIWVHAVFLAGPVEDDSFISYRYSANLVNGHGLVFNPGERVEGYTNFLWTALGALGVGLLKIDPITWSAGSGVLLGLITIAFVYVLALQHVKGLIALLPPLLFALNSGIAYSYVNGMETGVFTLWVVMAMVFLGDVLRTGRRTTPLGIVLLLAVLTRPEGNILAGCVLLVLMLRKVFLGVPKGRSFTAAIGIYIVGNTAYFLWRHAYYGFWLPNTFYAKVGATSAQIQRGFDYAIWFFSEFGILLLIALVLGIVLLKAHRGLVHLVFFTVVYILYIVAVGGDYKLFPRFFIPIFPLLYVICAAGLDRVLGAIHGRIPATVLSTIAIAVVVWGCAEAYYYSGSTRGYLDGRFRRMKFMTAVGKWAAENTPEEAVIACKYIGAISYYSERHVLDMHGLTNLHIGHKKMENLGEGKAGHEKEDLDYVLEQKPDYIFVNLKKRITSANIDEDKSAKKILSVYDQKLAEIDGSHFFYYQRKR